MNHIIKNKPIGIELNYGEPNVNGFVDNVALILDTSDNKYMFIKDHVQYICHTIQEMKMKFRQYVYEKGNPQEIKQYDRIQFFVNVESTTEISVSIKCIEDFASGKTKTITIQ